MRKENGFLVIWLVDAFVSVVNCGRSLNYRHLTRRNNTLSSFINIFNRIYKCINSWILNVFKCILINDRNIYNICGKSNVLCCPFGEAEPDYGSAYVGCHTRFREHGSVTIREGKRVYVRVSVSVFVCACVYVCVCLCVNCNRRNIFIIYKSVT